MFGKKQLATEHDRLNARFSELSRHYESAWTDRDIQRQKAQAELLRSGGEVLNRIEALEMRHERLMAHLNLCEVERPASVVLEPIKTDATAND